MTNPFLSVIVPVHNEAERIALALIELDMYLVAQEFSYELLVIDNDSGDATAAIVKKLVPVIKNLKIIGNPNNRGISSAVKIGNVAAKGSWRLIMTPDTPIPISQFANFLPLLSAGREADILIVARGASKTKLNPRLPVFRRLADYCLNKFAHFILKSKVTDFLLDFQCFSESASEKIMPLLKLAGPGYLVETLALAEHFGLTIKELPITAIAAGNGQGFDYLQIYWETFKIRWWMKSRKYEALSTKS